MKSVQWTCEYRDCDVSYTRYDSQIKKNIKKFCCQSHAALEQHKKGVYFNKKRTILIYQCKWCGLETSSKSKTCKECRRILERVSTIRKRSGSLGEFTPADYYKLLEKQDGKCAICKTEKCTTGRSFSIDHNHKTGEVRGLLCVGCNIRLGWYENNIIDIDKYLGL